MRLLFPMCVASALLALLLLAPRWPAASSAAAPVPAGRDGAVAVPVARCFAPGTPWAKLDGMGQDLPGVPDGARFLSSTHWTETATDGPGIQRGDPITLTWGIVPDGTPIPSFGVGRAAPSALRARLNALYDGEESAWLPFFQRVFDRWGEVTGVRYVHEPNDDGAAFSDDSGGVGVLGLRPDLRIGGRPIDGDLDTLAFNFFPNVGDMVIDTEDGFFEDLSADSLKLRNALSHEHGHGLGLDHICPVNETKLLEPFASTQFEGPQADDILRAQRQHGDAQEPNDSRESASALGVLANAPLERDLVSLDGSSDVDYYTFSTEETALPRALTVTVTPVGSTYLRGKQVGGCSGGEEFDSLARRDLSVELLDGNGIRLALANTGGAGSEKTLHYFQDVGAVGPHTVRVFGDGIDAAQRYRLTVAPVEFPNDVAVFLAATPQPVVRGTTQTLTATVRHTGPGEARGVVLDLTLPPPLVVDRVLFSQSSGNLAWSAHAVRVEFSVLIGPAERTVTIEAHHTRAGHSTVTAQLTRSGETDPYTPNNGASLESHGIERGHPQHSEDFERFPGLAGRPGSPVPNETTGFFDLRYDYAATTATGFALDTTVAQNGRGLHFRAAEDNAMETTADFPAADYTSGRHQIAFWFRYGAVSDRTREHLTQTFFVYNRAATNLAYALQCGVDHAGTSGAAVIVPIGDGKVSTPEHSALAPDRWHAVVIQYTSATDTVSRDGGIRVWFNPVDGTAAPAFEIESSEGVMGAEFGAGPFGRYAFGASAFPADPEGPDIWLDRIGTWNGYGEAGTSDLEAALHYLYATIRVPGTAVSVDEGDVDSFANSENASESESESETSRAISVSLTRSGDPRVQGRVDWSVLAVGAAPVDGADFPGGILPSGSLAFAENETSQTLRIPIAPDDTVEADETFEIRLVSRTEALRLDQTVVPGLIRNDDGLPAMEIALDAVGNLVIRETARPSSANLTIQADGGSATYVVADAQHRLRTTIAEASGDGTGMVRIPFRAVTGSAVAIRTGAGSDSVTLDLAPGDFPLPISYQGGDTPAGARDVLIVSGGENSHEKATLTHLSASSGGVDFDGRTTLVYGGLESIAVRMPLSQARLVYGSRSERIEVRESSAGQTLLQSDHGVATTLLHPRERLQVEAGGGEDQLVWHALSPDYPASVLLDGQGGDDGIQIRADVRLAATAEFTTTAERIDLSSGGSGPDLQVAAQVWKVDGHLQGPRPGTLVLACDLLFAPHSAVTLGIDGATGTAPPWQVRGNRRVDLANARLQIAVAGGWRPSAGERFTLLSLEPGAELVAPFAGLGEGAQVAALGENALFAIGYGDGGAQIRNVVLTTLLDYPQWREGVFAGRPETLLAQRAAMGNPDADDWPNSLEYLTGLDPALSDDIPFRVVVKASTVEISYPRVRLIPEGVDILEWSDNLLDWQAAAGAAASTRDTLDDGREEMTWTVPVPDSSRERLFYRLVTAIPLEKGE